MNRASKCMSQRNSSIVTALWTQNTAVLPNTAPRSFSSVLSASTSHRNGRLKGENSLCKGKQLWHMLNERLHSIVRRNLLGRHLMFKCRNVSVITINTDLKNDFSTSTNLCYTSKRYKTKITKKDNKSSLENLSWHVDDDPGLNHVLSQIQNHVTKDTESESANRVSSPYQTGDSSSSDMMFDGNVDDIDGMESQIIQRIERYADNTVESSHNIEILSEEDSELVDLTMGGNSVLERRSHEKEDFHSDRSSQRGTLRDQDIEDFTSDGKFSRDEIEDFYEEELVEEEVPVWTSPVELTRGKTGVFDLDDLVAVLKSENARDLCVMRLPAEARLCDYMIVASGMSARHVVAIVDTVKFIYKKKKLDSDPWMKVEGGKGDDWVAADLGNIILHVMMPETREHYDLETLWTVGAEYDDKCKDSDDNYLIDLDWLRELNQNQINQ